MGQAGARYLYFSALSIFAALLALSAVGPIQQASAHPVYVDSEPRAFESVRSAPTEVSVFFSEAIELDYSSISVLGPEGTRVDRNDRHYVQDDTTSIAVTMPPGLPEGEYTVTTRVLSAVDGHVVEETFVYGYGTSQPPDPTAERTPLLAPEYSASRFPGMVGQIMAVGAAFGALWLWKPISRVKWLHDELASTKIAIDKTMMKIIIVGAALVIASGIAMIIVQAISIDSSIQNAIATKFGNVWITRMLQSSILMGIALAVYRRTTRNKVSPSKAELYALLIIGLAVLVTSSLIAHAAATEQAVAIILDFFHNAAASLWIGGIILLGFAVVPRILSLNDARLAPAALSLLIPRFSVLVVTLLGIAVITGPILLSALESDISLTVASLYGQILAVKLALAGVMVAMGAYSQFVVEKRAIAVAAGGTQIASSGLKRYDRTLKIEAGVGIALLAMVSLMTNGALPSGQFPAYERDPGDQQAFAQEIDTTLVRTAFVDGGRVRLTVSPFALGENSFLVSFIDDEGNNITSIRSATLKMTQIERGIGPISVELKETSGGTFRAEAAFSLPGTWAIEIEGVNLEGSNLIAMMDLQVKPLVENLEFRIDQFKIPGNSLPLFPLFDAQRQAIWVGDTLPGSGRIWQLDIQTGNYTVHAIPKTSLITQTVLSANDSSIWFIDPIQGALGNYVPKQNTSRLFKIPDEGVVTGLAMDQSGKLWMPVVQPNTVVSFNPAQEQFQSHPIPTADSTPVGIAVDRSGNIWFAEAAGSIGRIDPATGNITEFRPDLQRYELDEPTAVFPDPRGSGVFISEHGGSTVSYYSPLLGTFREYPVVNDAGLPFGMAMDGYGNLWFAQHEIDRLGVIDPRTGTSTELKIPITGSFIQWLTSDDRGRIWFAAQRGGALGSVTITAKPAAPGPGDGGQDGGNQNDIPQIGFSLSDVAGPGIAAGIVISALAYAKGATDLSRNSKRLQQRHT